MWYIVIGNDDDALVMYYSIVGGVNFNANSFCVIADVLVDDDAFPQKCTFALP